MFEAIHTWVITSNPNTLYAIFMGVALFIPFCITVVAVIALLLGYEPSDWFR